MSEQSAHGPPATSKRGDEHVHDRDDLAVLGSELRLEISQLRTEVKTEMRDLTAGQTRTMMLGPVGSVTALAVTQLLIAAI
jgi:hypothetical protein